MEIITKKFFRCKCGQHDFMLEHLLDGKKHIWGTWYCDHCGQGYEGVVYKDKSVAIKEDNNMKKVDTFVLLKMNPNKPIHLIVRGINRIRSDGVLDSTPDNNRYFYGESTCPSNVLHDVEEICEGNDNDPHGIFEYLGRIVIPMECKDPELNLNEEHAMLSNLMDDLTEGVLDRDIK